MMWGGFGEIVDFVPINSPQILWPTIVQQHRNSYLPVGTFQNVTFFTTDPEGPFDRKHNASHVFSGIFNHFFISSFGASSELCRYCITSLAVDGFGLRVASLAGFDVRGPELLGLGLLKIAFGDFTRPFHLKISSSTLLTSFSKCLGVKVCMCRNLSHSIMDLLSASVSTMSAKMMSPLKRSTASEHSSQVKGSCVPSFPNFLLYRS